MISPNAKSSNGSLASRRRRLDGWGFEGEAYAPPERMLQWLATSLEPSPALPRLDLGALVPVEPEALPDLGCEIGDELPDRLAHARGRGFSDLVRLRTGTVPRLPDGVVRPHSDAELETVLQRAAAQSLRVIPWGGGTSVTGGVNVLAGDEPVISLDLERLSGLTAFDEASALATFGAGTTGPGVEAALAPLGFTLGHFPQSWELSTVGGWVATRSAGQESLGYGRIESLVAGLEVVAPAGRLALPPMPASATGPDLRQWMLGSEGRFGVISRACLRLSRRPETRRVAAALVRDWRQGTEAVRHLVRSGCGLSLLRLSDAPETEVAMSIGLGKSAWGPLVRSWLRWRGFSQGSCLLLLGASGGEMEVDDTLRRAKARLSTFGSAWMGERPGKTWLAERFRHPYLRDGLFDHGIATDTFETAAPWSRLPSIYAAVRAALKQASAVGEKEIPVLCHLSHPYPDGASLYFTFFFRCPPDPDQAIARWAHLKRRATEALRRAGGTLSHHHGVGSWHAPWYGGEVGQDGLRLVQRVAEAMDPKGTLNPHVLLAPEDRLLD